MIDALKAHPNVNASYNEDAKEVTYYDARTPRVRRRHRIKGLLSPGGPQRGRSVALGGLARAINDIAARASPVTSSRTNCPAERSITSIGSQGALSDPIPWCRANCDGHRRNREAAACHPDEFGNRSIVVRSVCYLPLTYDHHRLDGARRLPDSLTTTVKRRLEEGEPSGADLGCGR